jgi:hypothetical protein
MSATAQDLGALEALANSEGFTYLGRMIDVVSSWISSPNLTGNVPPDASASAGADLVDFLDRLPKTIGDVSEVEYVLGYKPLDLAVLPKTDAAEVVQWHEFRSLGIRHCADTYEDDPDELRKQWMKLVDDLAVFIGQRRRIGRQLKSVRASRQPRG